MWRHPIIIIPQLRHIHHPSTVRLWSCSLKGLFAESPTHATTERTEMIKSRLRRNRIVLRWLCAKRWRRTQQSAECRDVLWRSHPPHGIIPIVIIHRVGTRTIPQAQNRRKKYFARLWLSVQLLSQKTFVFIRNNSTPSFSSSSTRKTYLSRAPHLLFGLVITLL